MQVILAAPLELCLLIFEYRLACRFRGQRKTVRSLVHVGQIDHELDVVHAERMLFPMLLVAVPTLVQRAVVGPHQPQPDLAKAERPAHQRFNRRVYLRVPDEFVELRRGDQCLVVGVLVVAVAVPEVGILFHIPIEHVAEVLHLVVG